MIPLQCILLLLLPFFTEGVRISQETSPAACSFPSSSPILLSVSSDASIDTLIYRSQVFPSNAILSLASVTSTKLPHINYTNRFDLTTDGYGKFSIRTKGRLSLPPYPSDTTSANLYMSVICNDQVFPLITLRLDGGNRVSPRFYGLPYAVSLPRKSPVGTEVNTGIIAIDWDPSPSYGVHFTIMDDWAPFSLVVRPVSSNSPSLSLPLQGWSTDQFPPQIRLKMIGSIDHLPNEFDLNIAAMDSGEPVKMNTTTIHVNLLGDYRPLVRESRVTSIIGEAKMGDQILVIPSVSSVVDEEIGPVIYSLVDKKMKDYFEIDSEKGSLTLIEQPPLTIKSIGVMITSTENPPRSSIVEITLQRDAQFPRFSSCDFSVSLPENSKPGTHVFEMHVIDKNHDTRIRLIDPDETFSLDQETGIITVNDPTVLDSEHFDLVQFVIQIEPSNGSIAPPSVCQKARVTVHLIDQNDNSPLFDQSQYIIRVISPLPNNTLLRSIRAIDYDKGDNGRVEYRLMDSDNLPIRLVSTNGTAELIYSQRPNTRPLIGRYYVTLEAVDHGEPQRFGRAIIEIEADDLSGLEEGLEKKLREEEREKRVAKVADHTKNEETTTTPSHLIDSTKTTIEISSTVTREVTTPTTEKTTESTTMKTSTIPQTTTTSKKTTERTTKSQSTSIISKTTTVAMKATNESAIPSSTTPITQKTSTSSTKTTTVSIKTTEKPSTSKITANDEKPSKMTPSATPSTTRVTKTVKESKKKVEIEKEKISEEEEEVRVKTVRKHINHELDEAEEEEEPMEVRREEKESKRKEDERELDTREEEEIVSRYHRDEVSTPVRKIFEFNQPSYSFELFGEWKEGEIIGRVTASPDAMFYAMDKKAANYFKIDGDSGDIIVRSEAEKLKGEYSFTISSTNGEFTTESLVTVRLDKTRSIFDSAPTFDQSVYTIHIEENEEPKPLTSLRAYHRGLSSGSSLIYSLLDDGANVPFYLDEKSGQLVLLAPLDHEKTKEISFKVSACLSSNPSSCGFSMVKIVVDDVNDNPPILNQREITVKLPSDLRKGSTVAHFKATDKDSKENGEISYAINPPSNTFAIDIDNGEVITLGPLEHAHYEMAIQAFDHGSPRRSDIGRLTVNVQGTNPSAPQFDQFRYDITLSGPVKTGERVVSLHASDPDPGDEGIVSYRFATPKNGKESRDQSRFSMNPHTGTVTTLTPLNSFDGPFLFVVEAVDHSKEFPRKAEIVLRIRIKGEPSLRFFALPSTLFISSNKGIGSVLLKASASSSEGTPITFSISPPSQFFSMDGPNLIVTKSIEPKEYNITIRAETNGATIDHNLHLIVMTNRDKYPVFSRLFYDLPVSLDSSFPSILHTFQAQVQTGSVEYSLFPPKAVPSGLTIDKHTGELTVSEDFISSTSNTEDTVFTVVRAWNSEFPQFHSDVGVILSIETPSAPFGFPLSLYRTIMNENTPVGTLLNSSVTIAPKSVRTGVEYGITPTNIIGIHSNGSLFVSGPIDIEAMPVDEEGTLTYTIWAESGDERAVSTMRVKIVNVNEFTPVFRQKTFRFNVDESSKPGVILGRIIADDADFGEKLIYSMKSESRADSIDILPNGSVVVGKAGIDFDNDRAFDLVVSVEDSTGKTDEATVEIVVIADENRMTKVENDSPIVWNLTSESVSPLPITAVDSNEKDSIEFKIVNGNERGFFEIERVNRTAVLLKPVSLLPPSSHFTLTIEAVDSTKISTSRVIVNVAPSSSSPSIPSTTSSPRVPLFSQSEFAKAMKDDTPVGTALISVQVWSPPQDGQLTMSSNCSFLNVRKNGVVLLSTPIPIQSGEIDCGITASNEHSSTTAPFHLLVLDSSSSNHAPIFDRSLYNFSISVDSFASMVGKINVHDEDGDEIKLEIQPPEYNNLFEINEQNELELRFPASTLTDQNLFSFIIVASDDGKPKQTSIANVKVFVINRGKKGGFFPIASSASTNTLINPIPTSLTALSTPNSNESKEIETTTVKVVKEKTTTTSHSTTKEAEKETTTKQVELVTNDFTTVVPPIEKVTENTSELSTEIEEEEVSTIKNEVNQVENNEDDEDKLKDVTTTQDTTTVKFSKKEYEFEVKKDARVGTIIGTVNVDGYDSSSLEFMIGDERVVTVDEKGQISLTGPVIPSPYRTPIIVFQDGRILDEATLVIEYATTSSTTSIPPSSPSSSSPSSTTSSSPSPSPSTSSSFSSLSRSSTLTSSTPSTTTVLRVEGGTSPRDYPSVSPSIVLSTTTSSVIPFSFSHSIYTAYMPEGAYMNGSLVQLTPSNIHTNGKDVTFALQDSEGLPFVLNETTGELAMFRVDREERKEFDLIVKAFDHSSNEESTAKIHVEIIDVNDNSPIFESVPSIIGVRRNISVGSVIGRVSAIDGDNGVNGELSYSIQPSQYFAIDQKRGSIIVRTSLLSVPSDQLTMTVVVSDGGRPSLKAETEIEVRLFSSILSPTLPRSSTISISPSTTIIANLLAVPNVGDENESVTYTLDSTHEGLFTIDAEGILSLGREARLYEVNKEHKLKITATNNFGSESTEIGVTIVDGTVTSPSSSSSSPPSTSTHSSLNWEGGSSTVNTREGSVCMFPVREYRAEIKENLPAGTPVIKVSSDCEARRESVKYTLAVNSLDFSVDSHSGDILTLRPLDREEKAIHLLVVNVTREVMRRSERGTQVLRSRLSSSQTIVIVRVIDENDSSPEWKHLNGEGKMIASMDWKTPVGSPLMKIHAIDKDEKKSRLKYSIEGDVNAFGINETTGLIYLQKSVEKDSTDMYSLTGLVTDGVHHMKVPIEIYRLSTQHHLVKLISERRHVDIDAKKLESEINNATSLDVHILSKQPFVDQNGIVDPRKSFLFIYALNENHIPMRGKELIEWLSPHSASLYQTSGKISSFSAAQPSISISFIQLLWILVALLVLVALFIVCCVACSFVKRRRLRELEKQYMVDGMRPRPYDVENISRSTAQTVLSSRRLANAIPDDDRMSRTSNRSDTTFVFANSVKDENSLRRSVGRNTKVQDSSLS